MSKREVKKFSVSMDFRLPMTVVVEAADEDEALQLGIEELRNGGGSDLWEAGNWIYDSAEANIETEVAA